MSSLTTLLLLWYIFGYRFYKSDYEKYLKKKLRFRDTFRRDYIKELDLVDKHRRTDR